MKHVLDYLRASAVRCRITIRLHGHLQSLRARRVLDLFFIPLGLLKSLWLACRRAFCPRQKKPVRLSVVAIVKNEAPYLREWIAYHRLVGVERFYIFDNDSTDETAACLKSYVDSGVVVYRNIHGKNRQNDAYNLALDLYGREADYMAFIDLDEFLYATDGAVLPQLEKCFTGAPHIGGVCVNWALFGSSHLKEKPQGTVIENYLLRSDESFEKNRHIKTVCRPEKTLAFLNPHSAVYRLGSHAVTVTGERNNGPLSEKVVFEPLRLNHYFTKSYSEFLIKRNRGKADNSADIRSLHEFEEHDINEVRDEGMLVYAAQLREKQ